jgi:hypothetical protein
MVFEYLEHDLAGLMGPAGDGVKKAAWFSLPQIKCYAQQMFRALYFVHKNNIIHRDVKGTMRSQARFLLSTLPLCPFHPLTLTTVQRRICWSITRASSSSVTLGWLGRVPRRAATPIT